MQLFGHDLFTWKKPLTEEELKLYDFAQHGIIKYYDYYPVAQLITEVPTETVNKTVKKGRGRPKKGKKKLDTKLDEPSNIHITPKGLYMTRALNDNTFAIKTDPDYIQKQIEDCQLKLDLMYSGKPKTRSGNGPHPLGSEEGAAKYGKLELESIIERLKNRARLEEFKPIVDKYPHTTSLLINQIMETHKDILRFRKADSFVPDFPTAAVKSMAEYNKMCQSLCKKDTYFYVLAQKQDFEKISKRRDPILFAESPFGFFWQILGAWDEEMIYLGDL